MIHSFTGHYDPDGIFIADEKRIFREWLDKFQNIRVILNIQKWYKKRTNPENRYLWGVVYPAIADYSGMSADEAHDFCKTEFLKIKFHILNKETGELIEKERIGSTAKLTTIEFEVYTENIRRFFLLNFGLIIPLPNEIIEPSPEASILCPE